MIRVCAFLFLSLLCVQAAARNDSPVARVAAGIVLAETAIAREDAGLLLTGIEMIRAHSPQDEFIEQMLEGFEAEALFLMRGDPQLSQRLQQAQDNVRRPGQTELFVIEAGAGFDIPETHGVSSFASDSGVTAQQLLGPSGADCRRSGAIWECNTSAVHGADFRPVAGKTGWVVLEIQSVAQ